MKLPVQVYPPAPAQVEPYLEVLGPELTVQFLLRFGGAELVLSANPTERSALVKFVGREKAQALSEQSYRMQRRVPLAKQWLTTCLHAEGKPINQIARTLRATDVSVRKWLKK